VGNYVKKKNQKGTKRKVVQKKKNKAIGDENHYPMTEGKYEASELRGKTKKEYCLA